MGAPVPWRAAAAAAGAALLAVGFGLMRGGRAGLTARMHGLLAAGEAHAPPGGVRCDAGVVLGYALHVDGRPTAPLCSRVEVGLALLQKGVVDALVFSGAHPGSGERGTSEANAMADYAAALAGGRTADRRWLLEDASTSTRTNALHSIDLLLEWQGRQRPPGQRHGGAGVAAQQQAAPRSPRGGSEAGDDPQGGGSGGIRADGNGGRRRGWEAGSGVGIGGGGGSDATQPPGLRIVLVTSPFHQLRSYRTFVRALQQRGLLVQDSPGAWRVYVAPAPFAGHSGYGAVLDAAADQWDWWRELGALVWYAARGWV